MTAEALHDALRKQVIEPAGFDTGTGQDWARCLLCCRQWCIRWPEDHEPGCLAAPAAQLVQTPVGLAEPWQVGEDAQQPVADAPLCDVSNADVDAFAHSLRAKGTPWANGCAALMEKIWCDRERLRIGVADGRADALPKLTDVTKDDMWAFVRSLNAKDTPWADGCAKLIAQLWDDREALRAYLAQLPAHQEDPAWQPETKHDL